MKEQLIEMGFIDVSGDEATWFEYELDTCTLVVERESLNVFVDDETGDSVQIAHNATIEQISNILKSIQI
jgi:hypothetical protein